ncbi:MAG: DUF108 domain-containing protein [Candidatus Omnitrophica bacterium]|nr:DUF108 domain-containing protein [Candidatus Omnitrophota bacterium]
MDIDKKYIRVGVLGCGAIGSGIAKSISGELKKFRYQLTALYDVDPLKSSRLQKNLHLKNIVRSSFENLLVNCDLVVEAVASDCTIDLVARTIKAKKIVLVMSVGQLLKDLKVLKSAEKYGAKVLIPSGAIAGIDAIKAGSSVKLRSVTLSSRKPVKAFRNNIYLENKGFDLGKIKKDTVLFSGNVAAAVKAFPQNVNVAATLALACGDISKVKIQLIASPKAKLNSHEIVVKGDFGTIMTKTDNEICPDNPKTSYLAVLSAIQTLKDYSSVVRIGT